VRLLSEIETDFIISEGESALARIIGDYPVLVGSELVHY